MNLESCHYDQNQNCQYLPLSYKVKSGLSPPHLCGFLNAPIIPTTFLQEIILVCAVYQLILQSFKYQVKNPRGVDTLQQ